VTFSLLSVLWALYAYSLAFKEGSFNAIVGGFSHAFLAGIKPDTVQGVIHEYVFMTFQLTFAAITPALIIGAFAERMKFSAVLWFMALWLTFIYAPIAHMVWGGVAGWPDETSPAARWFTSARSRPGRLPGAGAHQLRQGHAAAQSGVLRVVPATVKAGSFNVGRAGRRRRRRWFWPIRNSPPQRCWAGCSPSGSSRASRRCWARPPARSPGW
jgi:hypothetical protein